MATLQARFFLFAFAALAVAITYNATFRQDGSHPAPMSAQGSTPSLRSSASRRGTPRIARTLPKHIETTSALPRSENVLAIQKRLSEKGYEPGPADGVLGDLTRAAIIAHETDNSLPVTGVASDQLLKSMILGLSPTDTKASADAKTPVETTEFIKSVQKTLASLGYDPGPLDGLIGVSTSNAIRKFQADKKLPVTGRISGRLVKELKSASGGRLSVIVSI